MKLGKHDEYLALLVWFSPQIIAVILAIMVGCCAKDYGAREHPRQRPGQTQAEHWKELKEGHWY